MSGSDAAIVLFILLPRLNRHSAEPSEIDAAVASVDRAEQKVQERGRAGGKGSLALILGEYPARILSLEPRELLALEMAVTEYMELHALEGNAIRIRPRWQTSERIAAIADSLLLPFVAAWLEKYNKARLPPA